MAENTVVDGQDGGRIAMTDDDFELVSESNLESLMAGRSRRVDSPSTIMQSHSNDVMEAAEAFELIQKEHKLLKDELLSQSFTLRERLTVLEERDRRKNQEIASLKNELDAIKLALTDKEIQQQELQRQLNYFKECSEKVDVMAAKVLESEDIMKHQNSIIQQFQADGFVSVQPPMLTDHLLAKELQQKDDRVKRLEAALANVESEGLKAQEENHQLKETISELRGLVTAFQSQAELDKADWNRTRDELEQQINELVERMSVLDPVYVAAQPQRTAGYQDRSDSEGTLVRDERTCPRCYLSTVDGSNHPCPGQIDGLD